MTTRSARGAQRGMGILSRRLEDIGDIARTMTRKRTLEQILAALMEVATRTVSAEVGGIVGKHEDRLFSRVSWGLDASLVGQLRLDLYPLIDAVYRRRGLVTSNHSQIVMQGDRQFQVHDLLAVPVMTGQDILGVLVLVNSPGREGFSLEDEDSTTLLVALAAIAIDNAQLMARAVESEKLAAQLKLAETVQRTLLPERAQAPIWLDWHAHYQPAYGIGGDYFDVIVLDSQRVALVVGDVSSHGIPAALLMTAVRTAVRAECHAEPSPAGIMTSVNRILCSDFDRQDGMFVSLFVGVINSSLGELHYCNAGHPAPYLWDVARLVPVPLSTGGPILGQFEDAGYGAAKLSLHPGWWLFAYTDGLTESSSVRGEFFGTDRILQEVSADCGLRGEAFVRIIQQAVEAHTGSTADRDDLTMLWAGSGQFGTRMPNQAELTE